MSGESATGVTSLLWGPVVIVTAAHAGQLSGQVAISCISASIVPGRPRLLASLWKLNYTHDLVALSGVLALHTLRRRQTDLVKHFGLQSGRQVDKFAGLDWRPGAGGAPILSDCHGWVEGRVVNALDGGDMTTYLVDVGDGERNEAADDLLTWGYLRNHLDPELAEGNEARRNREEPWNRAHLDQLGGPFYRPSTGARIDR